jgi:hypothetical protein
MLWPTVSLGVKPHLGSNTRFLLVSDSCGFADVMRPLWQEDSSVIYNCCWSSPAKSFLGPCLMGLTTIFNCLRFQTPSTLRAKSPYLCHPGTRGHSCSPRRRLLRLPGVWWRYLHLPPHRHGLIEPGSFYDWQFTANQFILAPSLSRLSTRVFLFCN